MAVVNINKQQSQFSDFNCTKALCNKCLEPVQAYVRYEDGKAYLEKTCEQCGITRSKISNHSWFYSGLRKFYFSVVKKTIPQNRFLLFFTSTCNLSCPVCYLKPYENTISSLTKDEIEAFLKERKQEVVLYGAEPTCSEDLFDLLSLIRKYQKNITIYTNGLKLQDAEYVKKLKNAGITKVVVQFDGFNEIAYQTIRGKPLLKEKMQCLKNLKDVDMPVILDVTVMKTINEDQCGKILEYALKNDFIRGITWLPFTEPRKKGSELENKQLLADDIIDAIELSHPQALNRSDLFSFEKLLYMLMSKLKKRVCLHAYHYWLIRNDQGYTTPASLFDLKRIDRALDRFVQTKAKHSSILRLFLLAGEIIQSCRYAVIKQVGQVIRGVLLMMSFSRDPHTVEKKFLHMVFETGCAPPLMDLRVLNNCVSGWMFKDKKGRITVTDDCSSLLCSLWEK